MKARLATSIGVLSLATAGAVAAFMFARKIPLAPPGPAPAAIVAGDKAAEKTRPIEPGKSLKIALLPQWEARPTRWVRSWGTGPTAERTGLMGHRPLTWLE